MGKLGYTDLWVITLETIAMRRLTKFCKLAPVLVAVLVLTPLPAQAEITAQNRVQITQLVRQAVAQDRADQPVAAWRSLAEADRLERLWSGNTLGDDAPAAAAWATYAVELIKREDGDLQKILHHPAVKLNDKLNLLRRLEQEVIMNYGGRRADGELIGPGGDD